MFIYSFIILVPCYYFIPVIAFFLEPRSRSRVGPVRTRMVLSKVLRSGVCEKYPEEHVPYLLKIRRYGEDTDTVRSEGEDTVEDTKIRSKIRTLSDRKEKIRSKIPRYGRRYQDTAKIR